MSTVTIQPLGNNAIEINSTAWGRSFDDLNEMPTCFEDAINALQENMSGYTEDETFSPCGDGVMLLSFTVDFELQVYLFTQNG